MSLENFIYSKIDKKKLKFLIIDEAQYIENIGLILKIFYDTFKREESNIKIIASGSGSLEVFR
jgi:predicted AAA+ superfamily ATPase